ncbi:hypothetical protein [Georgenia yuyongxinii]
MALPTARPWDQAADGMLTQADLPAGWHLAARFPGERSDDASGEIDRVLGYDDQAAGGDDADSGQNETTEGRWRYIEHEATATRVMIRLQRQLYATPEEVRITGVIYLPWRPGDPITSHLLRELPTAKIEAAINKRLFAMKRVSTVTGDKIILPSGRKVSDRDLLKPLGNPRQVPDFYESSHSSTAALRPGRREPVSDDGANQRRRPEHRTGLGREGPQPWVAPAGTPRSRWVA